MNAQKLDVAVIGGGVTGLACARRLAEKLGPARAAVFEASSAAGGIVRTRERDGFLIESGPDAFLNEGSEMAGLVRRLGIESELIATDARFRRSFVARDGRLWALPEGFYLTAPSRIGAFLANPLFSPRGKFRMLLEPFVPAKRSGDESAASFIRRRFGREAYSRAGEPMVAGIYGGDPEDLSAASTLARLVRIEREGRSVIRGLRKAARGKPAAGDVDLSAGASGPRYGLFLSFRKGMGSFIEAFRRTLPPDAFRFGEEAFSVERAPEGWRIAFRGGLEIRARAVCMALPARRAAAVLREPGLAVELRKISSESVAVVNLAWERADIAHRLDGFGFVVPRREGLAVLGCSFSSVKFAGRAPEGKVLMRVFVGGESGTDFLGRDDADLIERVLRDIGPLLGIRGRPLFYEIERFRDAMPQYAVGHAELVGGIFEKTGALPGLYLAGNSYAGVGIPDCIRQGEAAADGAAEFLTRQSAAAPVIHA